MCSPFLQEAVELRLEHHRVDDHRLGVKIEDDQLQKGAYAIRANDQDPGPCRTTRMD
jgi:hypothetical protein